MCGACVHMYTCSYLDGTLHYTVCKHVHLVQMKISESSKNVTEISTTEENTESSKNVTEISTTEENNVKYSHMENYMITQTQEELVIISVPKQRITLQA